MKKTEAAREGQRAFRWIFSLSGVLIGFAMAVYFIWTLTPRELLALPLVELSDTKQIRVSNLLGALLVFVAARIGIFYFRRLFVDSGGSHRLPMDQGRRLAVFQIGRYIVYLLAILLMLTSLNINLSVLIASSAALFIGIGLALQNTFSDIASGIVILVDRTIEVGDVIMLDSLELEGKVKEIRLRSTIIETLDAMTVIVPNSRFTTTNVVNWSFNDKVTRFRVRVGVAYGSNVQLVRKILVLAAQNHGLILNKPEPKVRFTEFGESSLDFELLFWTSRVMEYQDIKSDLRFKIEADFRKNGIQIPFPQRDLHIVSDFRQQEKESESPVVDGIDMEPKN
ncbi:MAG: mechanosensitive ion channel [Bacteroidia bacterium]|nr:mechanosensitive ion channel [Bacteroidia bacterium]